MAQAEGGWVRARHGRDSDAQRRPQNGSRGGTFRSNPDRQRGERRRLSARRLPVERRPGGRSPTADPLAVEVGEPVAPGARRSSPSARAPSRPRRRATGRIGSLECPGHSLTAVIGRRWTLVGHVAGSVGVGRATQPRRAPATVRHRPRSATAAGSPPPARLRREQSCGVAALGARPADLGEMSVHHSCLLASRSARGPTAAPAPLRPLTAPELIAGVTSGRRDPCIDCNGRRCPPTPRCRGCARQGQLGVVPQPRGR